jgi:hypothetical protein
VKRRPRPYWRAGNFAGAYEDRPVAFRDIPARVIAEIYDYLQVQQPLFVEQERTHMLCAHPGLPESAVRRRVVDLWLRNELRRYYEIRRHIAAPAPEPMRSSPIAQLPMLTASLNPRLEQTGGNFRQSF